MYEAENHELIKRLSTAASGPSVRLALTVSSGAALELVEAAEGSDNPYGKLKRHEESVLQDSVRADAAWVIARGQTATRCWTGHSTPEEGGPRQRGCNHCCD